MTLPKFFQGEIRQDVAIVNPDGIVMRKQVLDILETAARIQEIGLKAKDDGAALPAPPGKGFFIALGHVVRVDDEPLNAGRQEMIHGVCDEGPPPDRQQGFGAMVRQGPQAHPETCPQKESGFYLMISLHHNFSFTTDRGKMHLP
jgi:hypothetical protein